MMKTTAKKEVKNPAEMKVPKGATGGAAYNKSADRNTGNKKKK
jgi:hypothetical protein